MDIHQLNLLGANRTKKEYKKKISKILFFFLKGHYATFLDYTNNLFFNLKREMQEIQDIKDTQNANKMQEIQDIQDIKNAQNASKMQEIQDFQDANKKETLAIASRLKTIESRLHENTKTLKTSGLESTVTNKVKDTEKTRNRGLNAEIPNTQLSFFSGNYGNFILRRGEPVGDHIASNKFWDHHLKNIIEKYSNKDKIAIDIGAFIGFHTCFMAKYFANVVALEPQAPIFKILQANTLINNLDNITLHNKCAYSSNCSMQIAKDNKQEISIPKINQQKVNYSELFNTAALNFERTKPAPHTTEAITLDSLNLENVAFIKVDAQGSDLQVLIGAKETISRCRPVIAFEYEKELTLTHGNSLKDYEEFIKEIDYNLTELENKENKQIDYLATPLN